MSELIQFVENQFVQKNELPEFKAGDTVAVNYKIKEGNKERIQQYTGVVIQRNGSGNTATFTVRKISSGVGVERVFPENSPFLDSMTVLKVGKVRRSKLYYLRGLSGKSARIKEKVYVKN